MNFADPSNDSAVSNELWQQFELCRRKQRLGHALLLIGSPPSHLEQLALRMAAAILCKETQSPCFQCQSCQLMLKKEHPDFHYLLPEKTGGVIKIEQIRELQTVMVTSPQFNHNRVIMINPAEKLNMAAANALLKILEEPITNTYFILIAEQISTIPPTIVSRCQPWRATSMNVLQGDYLEQKRYYPPDSSRGQLFSAVEIILDQLSDLMDFKQDVNSLAASWTSYEFQDLIWFLCLINSQMIHVSLLDTNQGNAKLFHLAKRLGPVRLFRQLDALQVIVRKQHHSLNMNQLLVLENFLLGYVSE
jgi:DNA polymerase-3 subunit delta'